jgi:NAD(P)-dependent dehydrogenase (short-subunit alcohol dehydrogenase family)
MPPRTVFLTGASSGIGRALALEYAKGGARLALVARRKEELYRTLALVRERGGDGLVLPLDVTDSAAVHDAVARAAQDLGGLDMVIANAGFGVLTPAATSRWEDVLPMLRTNVEGAFSTLVAAAPIMVAQKKGHLVGISSLAGRRGLPQSGTYSATKAALSAFLESMRLDLAPLGIRVTDVQPGFVATPGTADNTNPMPFLWPVEKAARVIARRLERGPAIISFPWPLVMMTAIGRVLPHWLYAPIIRTGARSG